MVEFYTGCLCEYSNSIRSGNFCRKVSASDCSLLVISIQDSFEFPFNQPEVIVPNNYPDFGLFECLVFFVDRKLVFINVQVL